MLKNLLAAFLGIIIFLGIGEVGYRLYLRIFKPLYSPSGIHGLLWEPRPGAVKVIDGIEYRINSLGFRGDEYPLDKKEGVLRIAVIGDSVTWGYAEVRDTYPNIMERLLKDKLGRDDIEILNFGVEGTDTKHHLRILEERVMEFNPDLVILGFCLNDIRFLELNPAVLMFLENMKFADYIFMKLVNFTTSVRARLKIVTSDSYFKEILNLYNVPSEVSELRNVVSAMKKVLDEREIGFAVVIFPFRQQFFNNPSFTPQRAVKDICREAGIPVLDLYSMLRKHDPERLYLKGDVVHFSSYGNKVIAESITQFLYSRKLIPEM